MLKDYEIQFNEKTETIAIEEISVCPLCDHAIDPQFLFGIEIEYTDDELCAILVFRCTKCEDVFLARYNLDHNYWEQEYIYPNKVPPIKFEECIKQLSPRFVDIYSQAKFVEDNDMDELVGVSYRKSIEFLVKDYLIYKFPNKEQIIIDLALLDCINNYVKYDKLKNALTRATWIGNDFAHYERIRSDCDINDLKKFIKTAVFWITAELSDDDALKIRPIKKQHMSKR